MVDARRHSVDIPLSKTLMTLKRVRSLRDPSTISMSKFPSMNYVNWDINSCDETILEFKDSGNYDHHRSPFFSSNGRREEHGSDLESANSSRIADPKFTSYNKTSRLRNGEHRHSPYDSTCILKPADLYEDEANSYSGSNLDQSKKKNLSVLMKKTGYGSMRKLSTAVEDAARSRMGSPCMSLSEAQTNPSNFSLLGLRNEDANMVASTYSGCGLSSCWSRTPRFRDVNNFSDVEDQEHPLLSVERKETAYREMTLCINSPRSLSQKYRPKSFDELAGQHVIAQSLMNAISKGKVSPIYLFHGPRGTGKTSMARVFAAALNCLSLEAYRPCGFCRECVFLFSGRSRDVKELDGSKINRKDRVKALLKSVSLAPYSSSFKVFVIDECQFLQADAWRAILNSLEEIPRRVVFIMITSELDKLTHTSVSRCQRYHFPKIKDVDIVYRLQKICVEEVLDFDKEALDFIAVKSNGSLRDAEIMLDQLSLLGKRISVSLAYELIGVVSDDELLDLLDLSLSSDTSNTVRRARELMSSKVDPMQLVSQLANLIMDILAGRCQQSGCSEAGRNFLGRHTVAEVGLQKLRHALKILSETEKQLRTSKNQATWLTVALLQFSSEESSLTDLDDPKAFLRTVCLRDDALCCTVSPREVQRNSRNHGNSKCSERNCGSSQKMDVIWRKTVEKCQADSFRSFLLKKGKLVSIYVSNGLAVAEIQFSNPEHVSKAEKSWKQIASSLQFVLGCNVEIRINLVPCISKRNVRMKPSFCFLRCSARKQELSDSSITDENEMDTSVRRERSVQASSDDHGQHLSPIMQLPGAKLTHEASCFDNKEVLTIRSVDGNALCSGTPASNRSMHSEMPKECNLGSNTLGDASQEGHYLSIQEHENKTRCFPKALKLLRKSLPSDATHTIYSKIQANNKLESSIPNKASLDTCFCSSNSYTLCSRSDSQTVCSSQDEDISKKNGKDNSDFRCWGAPKSSKKKAWQQMHHHHKSQPAACILPCLPIRKSLQARECGEHA